jgi:GTP:adenosylcobinamide-phosphate guanylyltransferase
MLDAIVIAGGVPQEDEPLYMYTKGQPKALLDVSGKPMAQWVLDALSEAETIGRVVMIGLPADCGLVCDKIQAHMEDGGGILENIRLGVQKVIELDPSAHHVAVVSSDIPTILPEHVNWVVNTAMQTSLDVYYNVVSRAVMEARFPGSNRSYVHLKDVDVCGGDMNVLRTMTVTGNDALWQRIVASRKNALKQAALLGWDTFLLVALRQITLADAIKKVTKRVNLTGLAFLCPYAEVAMDVDKPHQLEIVRADLARGK